MDWFKKAEDIFETMDRRAKKVVNELVDEQGDSQPQASNGRGRQGKRTKSKVKAQRRPPTNEILETIDNPPEQPGTTVQSDPVAHTDRLINSVEADDKITSSASTTGKQSISQVSSDAEAGNAFTASSGIFAMTDNNELDTLDVGVTQVGEMDVDSHLSEVAVEGTLPSRQKMELSPEKQALEVAEEKKETLFAGQSAGSGDASLSSDTAHEISQPSALHSNGDLSEKQIDSEGKVELQNIPKKEEQNVDGSKKMGEEQLDEAQSLLKSTNSIGQSKEARLARVCAGLSSRLQEYKSENVQLEELLMAERELSKSSEYRIKQLQQELVACKLEASRVESNMAEALAAKNSEIKLLVSSLDELKKQNAISEGNLASLQTNMESLMRNRELAETRMVQALREELASAERMAEDERAAHNATKMAAMEREVELERRAVDASTALARIQRVADERTAKASDLEQKIALLEVECASLNQELQEMEDRARRNQKKVPEEANQTIQIQAWQEEVERARQAQRDAERKLSSLEAELQKMRVEMAAMRRDAEHYSRQEHMELEKRYRELTDLLYYKQTQLEAMASEKAAAEFQREKEIKRLQESQVEAERNRVSRRVSSSWESEGDLKTLETLPLQHRHMAAANIQKVAKLLDTGAVRATRFLWRYPTARVSLLFYLVFVHLFLMYLLHRLQAQADRFSSREVAESMGLANPTLP
uniref:Golgin candidate 1 n=1 Tax=Kalanchoe fedtschenkoi TaxID=63787 RepID=A0A7N1A805_KALFE